MISESEYWFDENDPIFFLKMSNESRIPIEVSFEYRRLVDLVRRDRMPELLDMILKFRQMSEEQLQLQERIKHLQNDNEQIIQRYSEQIERMTQRCDDLTLFHEQKIKEMEQVVIDKQREIQELCQQISSKEEKIEEIYNSGSWKITKPFRAVLSFVNRR